MTEKLNCIIPAAGEATRLRPHSSVEQKPTMLMGSPERRIIDDPLDVAEKAHDTFVILHHDPNKTRSIEKHVKSRSEATLLRDRRLMGAASLIQFSDVMIEPNPEGASVILPADHIIEGLDLDAFHEQHLERDKDVTMLTVPPKSYGQYVQEKDGVAMDLTSQPAEGYMSSAGIYIVKNQLLLDWARRERAEGWNGEIRSFLNDVIHPSVDAGAVATYQLPDGGYWDDAGTIERYHYNNMRLSGGENVIDRSASIDSDAEVRRSVIMGGAAIFAGAMIEGAIVSANSAGQYETKVA